MVGTRTLAARLYWARLEQGMTLQQLSERSGRAVSYLSQLEHGVRLNPTRHTVEALSGALGVRPAFLLGEVPSPPYRAEDHLVVDASAFTSGRRFRQYWQQLPVQERQDVVLLTPDGRFGLLARFLLERFAERFTPLELSWQLGMSLTHLQDLLAGKSEVSHTYLAQISLLVGLPLSFVTQGVLEECTSTPSLVEEAHRYVRAIQLALERSIAPERLEEIIRLAPEE